MCKTTPCFQSRNTAAMTPQSYPSHRARRVSKKADYTHTPHVSTRPEIKLPTRVAFPLTFFWLSGICSHTKRDKKDLLLSLPTATHVDVEHHVSLLKLLPVVDPRGHNGSHGGWSCPCHQQSSLTKLGAEEGSRTYGIPTTLHSRPDGGPRFFWSVLVFCLPIFPIWLPDRCRAFPLIAHAVGDPHTPGEEKTCSRRGRMTMGMRGGVLQARKGL